MPRRTCLVFAAVLGLTACSRFEKETKNTTDNASNPHYKQAQQDLDSGNAGAAATDYEAALAENPKLITANYELGLIYGDKLNDPVSSIYHYKRYLELDPSSDKADQVKAEIDKQGQAFASSLPATPGGNGPDIATLQSDNAAMKKQLADASATIAKLQAQLAGKHHHYPAMQSAAPAAENMPPPTPPLGDMSASNAPAPGPSANGAGAPPPTPAAVTPAVPPRAVAVDTNSPDVNAAPAAVTPGATNAAPAGPARSYTVVRGDSLWKIAHKMYPGDTKNGEDKIKDANKDVFSGKFLKPGQVLVIPQ
jgi:Tfp pilus assembly protein FimV